MDLVIAGWPCPGHSHAGAHDRLAYLGHTIILGGFGVQQAKVDALQMIPTLVDVLTPRVFKAWQTTTADLSRTLALSSSLLPFLQAKTNLGLGVRSSNRHSGH